MVEDSSFGILATLLVAIVASVVVALSQVQRRCKLLLIVALWLRVLGSQGYLRFIGGAYGGGDYDLYVFGGLQYAELIREGDWPSVFQPWVEPGWFGTFAAVRITGVVLYLIGPTESGAFIVFGLIGYVGIIAFWRAYKVSFPQIDSASYIGWVALFPSLWFWPAAVGKDAIVLCGIGLATLGFASRSALRGWLILVAGLFFVFIIRPQVAAVVIFAMAVAQTLGAGLELRLIAVVRLFVLALVAVATIVWSSRSMDVDFYDPGEVQEYLDDKSQDTNIGGSALDSGGEAGVSPVLAPINTLFRPFPWEATGISNLLAAIEVGVLWTLVFLRRGAIWSFFKETRRTPLFWMAVVFTIGYSVALGMTLTNVGMIARQRVHIFPFLFMLLAGGGRRAEAIDEEPVHAGSPAPGTVLSHT